MPMDEIMISINPFWCDKIIAGEKTLEIRKHHPKIKPPFKCFIYKTGTGCVIAEFVCANIYGFPFWLSYTENNYCIILKTMSCLTPEQVFKYGRGRTLYGFHITELKVYQEPRQLSDFRCSSGVMKRPPQSWCYCTDRKE